MLEVVRRKALMHCVQFPVLAAKLEGYVNTLNTEWKIPHLFGRKIWISIFLNVTACKVVHVDASFKPMFQKVILEAGKIFEEKCVYLKMVKNFSFCNTAYKT